MEAKVIVSYKITLAKINLSKKFLEVTVILEDRLIPRSILILLGLCHYWMSYEEFS